MPGTAVQLPTHAAPAARRGRRLFRKQVLPAGHLDVRGRRLTLDRALFTDLIDTFKRRVYDQVPFVLANERNEHNDDPERFRGEVQALEAADDGLYALVETTDQGAAMLEGNPRLPVSVRMVPPEVEPGKGRWVLAHVCGTLDPVAKGMKPWATVDASSDLDVLDLSGGEFSVPSGGAPSDSVMANGTDAAATAPEELTTDEVGRFRAFLDRLGGKDAPGAGQKDTAKTEATPAASAASTEDEGGKDAAPSDEEVDRVLGHLLADANSGGESAGNGDGEKNGDGESGDGESGDGESGESETDAAETREPVAASNTGDKSAVELATARISNLETQLSAERAERARERFTAERDRLVADGVPPAMVDLARPVLESATAGPIELSNGKTADPQEVVRGLLEAARGTVELSERGSASGSEDPDADQRKQWAEEAEKRGSVV